MTLSWRRIRKCYQNLKLKKYWEIDGKQTWKSRRVKLFFEMKCLLWLEWPTEWARRRNLKNVLRLDSFMKQILAILIIFSRTKNKLANKNIIHFRFTWSFKFLILHFVFSCAEVVELEAWEKPFCLCVWSSKLKAV